MIMGKKELKFIMDNQNYEPRHMDENKTIKSKKIIYGFLLKKAFELKNK
jgi:hypothetical protein